MCKIWSAEATTSARTAAEVAERLMRGDWDARQDLALTNEQCNSAADAYVQALGQAYEREAATPIIIEKIEAARPDPEVDSRSAGEGIPDSLTRRGAGENVAARPPGADEEPLTGRISRSGGSPTPDRERSLFDLGETEAVAETAARDRDQLEGERLTVQLNAPLTREEQLKKLKRSKDKPQQNLFEEEEPPAQGSFFLGSGLGALQPYVEKFIDGKLVPTARQAAEALAVGKKEVLKVLAPGSLPGAAVAHNIVRLNAAELARSTDIAEAARARASVRRAAAALRRLRPPCAPCEWATIRPAR